jgi:amino acid transporter
MTQTPTRLKRTLTLWEAIGISIALTAPSLAINLAPQASGSLVGKAVPLTFVLATVGVLLIAYTFVRLSQRFHHAGSVYGFVGATLGPRSGIFSGWALVGTYSFFVLITASAAGHFLLQVLKGIGLLTGAGEWVGFLFAALLVALVWFLATRPARGVSRTVLVIEGITILLIAVVAVLVLVRLLSGTAPHGQTFSLSVFAFPSGDPSDLFLGVVFGFLAFAGFEAAATLGEETKNPRRAIPRAILGSAIFGGVFFIVVTAIEVNGFGTGAAGIKAFTSSGSLLGDLGSSYVAPWIGELITVGVTVSAFGSALASAVGASRLIFALSSDGAGPRWASTVSPKRGVPSRAVILIVIGIYVALAVAWFALRTDPITVFSISGTTGVLLLLVAYGLATIGAIKLLFFSPGSSVRRWEIVIPILGLVVIVYTLFRNLWPLPQGVAWWGVGPALVWAAATLVFVLVRRETVRKAGERLAANEGLQAAGTEAVEPASEKAAVTAK